MKVPSIRRVLVTLTINPEMNMKTEKFLTAFGMAAALTMGGFAVGCDDKPDTPGEAVEKAGDQIEKAGDKAGRSIDKAADKVDDAVK